MFNTILVPTDGSELSDAAVHAAIKLAKLHGAKLVFVNVQMPFIAAYAAEMPSGYFSSGETWESEAGKRADAILSQAASHAMSSNISVSSVSVVHDHPYIAIMDAADEHQCDLIVMASHGRRGVAGLLLGSETQKVLTHCKVPVLIYR